MVSVIVNCHLQGCSKPKNWGGGGEELRGKKKIYNFALCIGDSGSPPGEISKFVIF